MSKSLKKSQAPKGTRPISDFFARKSSSLTSQSSLSTLDSSPSVAQTNGTEVKQRVSVNPKDLSSPRIFVPGNSPRKTAHKNASISRTEALNSPDTLTSNSATRTRTPDQFSDTTKSNGRSSPVKPRKNKFDSDSEHEQLDSVIYVARSSMAPSSRHGTPLSKPTPFTSKENLLLNPSQNRPRKKVRLSPDAVDTDNNLALSTSEVLDDWEIDTSNTLHDNNAAHSQGVPVGTVKADGSKAILKSAGIDVENDTGASVFNEDENPISFEGAPMEVDEPQPTDTEVLDPATKAARIIADIKAKAYASARLQPTKAPVLAFRDELSESSDEEDCMIIAPSKAKDRTLPMRNTSLSQPARPKLSIPSRSSTRQSSPSPATPVDESIAKNRPRRAVKQPSPPQKEPSPVSAITVKPKKKPNPLDALIKEKELADKRGHGEDAYRRAEAAISKLATQLENDDFTDLRYLDEEDSDTLSNAGSSLDAGHKSDGEGGIGDLMVRKRLFGEERAEEIRELIEGDKVRLRDEKAKEKTCGIPFWKASEDANGMDVDDEPSLLALSTDVGNSALKLLADAVNRQDWKQANLMLTSGVVHLGNAEQRAAGMGYLIDLAIYCPSTSLFCVVLQAITEGWRRGSPVKLGFRDTAKALVRLGADPYVFTAMGWTADGFPADSLSSEKREPHLFRLIEVIRSAARYQQVLQNDVSCIVAVMMLIANDPTTSLDIYRHLIVAANEVCNAVAPSNQLSVDFETGLCTHLLKYAVTLEPINQASIVNFLASGSGRMQRIARWLAFGLITNLTTISSENYTALPDLTLILKEFYDDTRSKDEPYIGRFEVTRETDYIDFAYYIQVLVVAVTDIPGYIVKERDAGLKKHESPLGILLKALDSLHSAISDGRAAHITRSRAKALLKQLSMRIHYQRTTASKEVGTLDSYWSKGRKP